MTISGNRNTFSLVLNPLSGPPRDSDPSASATWAAMEIWAEGVCLTEHVHTGTDRSERAVHWPAIYLARWLVRNWSDCMEQQTWPLPESFRNARDVCQALDRRALELEESEAPDTDIDRFLEQRDTFVSSHSFSAGSGGGFIPDLFVARDGDRVSVAWTDSTSKGARWFRYRRGEVDVPVDVFVGVALEFIGWIAERLRTTDVALCKQEARELDAWARRIASPEAAEAVLAGYLGKSVADLKALLRKKDWRDLFALPAGWKTAGSLVNPLAHPVAIAFRAAAPVLDDVDTLALLGELDAAPFSRRANQELAELSFALSSVRKSARDFEQGYELAETLRRELGNPAGHLDVEQLLRDWGVRIRSMSLSDVSIDGGAVWDDEHGPLVFVNRNSLRANVKWGRRMILAHELCHLLVDRAAVPRLRIVSSPWAPPTMERRANAFAAELLIPRKGILAEVKTVPATPSEATLRQLMDKFQVGQITCLRHLENRSKPEAL